MNPSLHSGERLIALVGVTQFKPLLDGLAITTSRLVAFSSASISQKGPKISIKFSEIERVDYVAKTAATHITVLTTAGDSVRIGSAASTDTAFIRDVVDAARKEYLHMKFVGLPNSGSVTPSAPDPAPPVSSTSEPLTSSAPRAWSAPRIVALVIGLALMFGAFNAVVDGEKATAFLLFAFMVPFAWAGLATPIRRIRAQKTSSAVPKTSGLIKVGLAIACAGLIIASVTAPENEQSEATFATVTTQGLAAADSTPLVATSVVPVRTAEPAAARFDESMVRAIGISKENKGSQSNVRFVGGNDDLAVLKILTEQCVDHYLEQTKAAYCYAYGSDKDYELKTFDWTPEFDTTAYGGSRPCWTHYSGQPLAGRDSRTSSETSGISYVVADCPGSVAFPDDDGALAAERNRNAEAKAAVAVLKPRDPCKLVDVNALASHGFKTVLGDVTDDPRAHLSDGALLAYTCQNSELELILTITEFDNQQRARDATAEFTDTPNSFLLGSGGFVVDVADGYGSAVINEEFGISEAHWANGQYGFAVTLNSLPPVKGLSIGQSASALVETLTTIASTANTRVATDNW
ncbi:hypothetical protein CJ178_29480 [Rhodococcus sp. ACPA4]|uniref:hypothetical protein n=1 Tax=Rhodococcus sp. ACPA4 TaxID=2028571 RepID=UPI000BD2825F|nr:hypothetical protein [Rhodococcus sp. ACPA4]PBC38121.1 hypothetical protein CJ178_29480 [Rhodococcus sp. ACPA4]